MSIIDNSPDNNPNKNREINHPSEKPHSTRNIFLSVPQELVDHPYTTSVDEFAKLAHSRRDKRIELEDSPPCLAFAGLAATADQWTEVLENHYEKTGARYEAHCLKGHEIGWTGLINTHAEDWVQDVIDRAVNLYNETGHRPIIMGHSTGALACITAIAKYARENPGEQLCSGLIISSPAFRLQSFLYTGALAGAKIIHKILPRSGVWNRFGASIDAAPPLSASAPIGVTENLVKGSLNIVRKIHQSIFKNRPNPSQQELQSQTHSTQDHPPFIKWIPVLTFLELTKIQGWAKNTVAQINVPTLAIISRRDYLTNPRSSINAFRRIPAKDKSSILIDGPHSMMKDRLTRLSDLQVSPSEAFQTTIEAWLEDRRAIFMKQTESSDHQTEPPPMNLHRLKLIIEAKNQRNN
jgi:alpha-beta hydrolase superfamily lysophospholipase